MTYHRYLILIALGIITVFGCQKKMTFSEDLYVGAYRIIDQSIPYPYFLSVDVDKYVLLDFKGNQIDSGKNEKITLVPDDTLKMKNHTYQILSAKDSLLNVFDRADSLLFPVDTAGRMYWKNRATFIKAIETPRFQIDQIKEIIGNHTFSSETISDVPNDDLKVKKTLHFYKDSVQTWTTYYYQNELVYTESQIQKITFAHVKNKVFFSANVDPEKPQTFYQIIDVSKSSITVRYMHNEYVRTEKYIISELPNEFTSPKVVNYNNCFDGHQGEYYYDSAANHEVTFIHGNDFLIKEISKNAPTAQGNGYFIIHFNINCRGQVGRLGVQQMDRSYKKTTFEAPFIKHIIEKVSNLKDWPPTESGYDFITYKDVHAFLMFKIETGKITDLCP